MPLLGDSACTPELPAPDRGPGQVFYGNDFSAAPLARAGIPANSGILEFSAENLEEPE